jgi:thiol:disulfide interchange protein
VRLRFLLLAIATILLGLLFQQARGALPPVLADMLGDGLWAAMIYWILGSLAPDRARWQRALLALLACWAVEASQLLHATWLDDWRSTPLGHLTLGTDFDPRDLLAYTLGLLLAFRAEPALIRGTTIADRSR